MDDPKREEQETRAIDNFEVFNKHKEDDNRELFVEQHYQKESGEQVWRNYNLDQDASKALDIASKEETDIAICENILKERGTEKNTTDQLSKSVGEKSPGAVGHLNQQEYGLEVVDKAQERLKLQEYRQPRENIEHQTVSHDASYMQSIEMLKERDR